MPNARHLSGCSSGYSLAKAKGSIKSDGDLANTTAATLLLAAEPRRALSLELIRACANVFALLKQFVRQFPEGLALAEHPVGAVKNRPLFLFLVHGTLTVLKDLDCCGRALFEIAATRCARPSWQSGEDAGVEPDETQ